ncbi:MAG: cytochrome c biogenesis heme-transporting ATPase CcmA [Gammaproteobacteria bacterium]|nr:MAG: cytochrome c biogenesis heme-transporting ATPase CcmA [Gammaproteobacteria bacterium]
MQVHQLECRRGERPLFSNLTFSLSEKELLWVSGPNGSGKTTLLRTLSGLLSPSAGEILWKGKAIQDWGDDYYADLLYLGHLNALKLELTVLENIRFSLVLSGQQCSDNQLRNALKRLGLIEHALKPCRYLSQGQKRRVALCRLLLDSATLWILDEPFVALDHDSIDHVLMIMRQHLNSGGRIILTTHQEVAFQGMEVKRVALDEN